MASRPEEIRPRQARFLVGLAVCAAALAGVHGGARAAGRAGCRASDSAAALDEAMDRYRADDFEAALPCLAVAEEDPALAAEARFVQALCHAQLGRHGDGFRLLREILESVGADRRAATLEKMTQIAWVGAEDPDAPAGDRCELVTWLLTESDEPLEPGEFASAAPIWRAVCVGCRRVAPGRVLPFAEALYAARRWDDVLGCLDSAPDRPGERAPRLLLRAKAERERGSLDLSLEHLEQALAAARAVPGTLAAEILGLRAEVALQLAEDPARPLGDRCHASALAFESDQELGLSAGRSPRSLRAAALSKSLGCREQGYSFVEEPRAPGGASFSGWSLLGYCRRGAPPEELWGFGAFYGCSDGDADGVLLAPFLFGGSAGRSRGLVIGTGVTTAESLVGLQLSLVNIGVRVEGVQLGLFSYVGKDATGLQIGAGNVVRGTLSGVQLGAAFNYAGGLSGVQVGAVNVAGRVDGVQVGVVNVATGPLRGAQLGLLNITRQLSGLQLGGIDLAYGELRSGVQLGGLTMSFGEGGAAAMPLVNARPFDLVSTYGFYFDFGFHFTKLDITSKDFCEGRMDSKWLYGVVGEIGYATGPILHSLVAGFLSDNFDSEEDRDKQRAEGKDPKDNTVWIVAYAVGVRPGWTAVAFPLQLTIGGAFLSHEESSGSCDGSGFLVGGRAGIEFSFPLLVIRGLARVSYIKDIGMEAGGEITLGMDFGWKGRGPR
jgi:tetratricopeptide (TPR) repeat protein